ncbi:alpha/beta hydrolase [Nakamurella aerolata]|uniref:Alpha/beta fold hydrolase n=1 Tax=Nakamurella aerolata TaxID=1656892 RepID=A0A849A260_9ACTN|nr:alpha/beta hydrolase [Nakamurella aerolata]NNG34699.1 alpha/beta fold hydrolase [Nakamurella aerolata]
MTSHPRPRRAPARSRPLLATVRALSALALVLVLAGCSGTVAGVPTAADQPATGAVPVPQGLERFYTQQLRWSGCADYTDNSENERLYSRPEVQCARMTVPIDYTKPDGQTAQIAVMKAPATGARKGAVVFNPGGPGASGLDIISQFDAYGVGADLNEDYDLVGFDPRGIGASVPTIDCGTDAQKDADRAANLRTNTREGVEKINASAQEVAQRCIDRTGKEQGIDGKTFLAHIGTVDVAKDMDVLRALLGEPKLTYVGYSYGTRLGTEYAQQFTPNVRAMILDGVVDPSKDAVTKAVEQGKSFQKTFDAFAASCARKPDCALGTDPAKANEKYQQLVRPLLTQPMPLPDGRVLTFDDATTGTAQALYSDTLWPQLEQALGKLAQADGSALMALADMYDGRAADGSYSNVQDAFVAVSCMDNPRPTAAQVEKANSESADLVPFMDSGDPPAVTKDVCDYWPAKPTLAPSTPKITGLPTLLVISTLGDPATPYQAGVDLAKQLNAALLTVKGERHTAYLGAGLTCVDTIGTTYLESLKVPPAGTTC